MNKFKPISLSSPKNKQIRIAIGILLLGLGVIAAYLGYIYFSSRPSLRWQNYRAYHNEPSMLEEYTLYPGQRCGDAPFAFPTTGVIFGLWNQSYRLGHNHAGLDIFPAGEEAVTAVYAVYDGYLTRQLDWTSTVIIRIPEDPLDSSRQIWTYYTHMATTDGKESFVSEAFPPGTFEVFVEAGTFLGYQGKYSGNPVAPVGLHLHFSIVREKEGVFLNELEIKNTYDPTPYFGFDLNNQTIPQDFAICEERVTFEDWELVEEAYGN